MYVWPLCSLSRRDQVWAFSGIWFLNSSYLSLPWRRSLSYRNQSTDLLCKSMHRFLYDRDLRHERVNQKSVSLYSRLPYLSDYCRKLTFTLNTKWNSNWVPCDHFPVLYTPRHLFHDGIFCKSSSRLLFVSYVRKTCYLKCLIGS